MSMLVKSPIVVFDLENMEIDKKEFIERSKNLFYQLPWDFYDVRKKQIDFLESALKKSTLKKMPDSFWRDYYMGRLDKVVVTDLISKLSPSQLEKYEVIKPFRRRAASKFLLNYDQKNDNWIIKRVPVSNFSQNDAKIENKLKVDYRACARVFSETSQDATNDEFFQKLIKGAANLVRNSGNDCVKKLEIVSHHTYVEATKDIAGDNSPEGIHQDGYDYIISALVIERVNIDGGVSQIFSEDKKTKLLMTELQPGQGIFQPDKGTSLWHNVTPFNVSPHAEFGYRTSIGLDIGII